MSFPEKVGFGSDNAAAKNNDKSSTFVPAGAKAASADKAERKSASADRRKFDFSKSSITSAGGNTTRKDPNPPAKKVGWGSDN